MHVFYYRGAQPNFGDDLNSDIWPRVLPPEALAAENTVLVGIGSILTQEWVGEFGRGDEQVIVLGSGTSYDVPPSAIGDWTVLAVRGPLTAELIGRPEAAVTDGAILLADLPDLWRSEAPRDEVLFMPHFRSIRRSPWAEIAAEAGATFVSPQGSVEEILAAYGRARLVVTEAMHGAIVADTLRIPWVPLTIAPTVDEFKWRDWCLSLDLPYEPVTLAPGDPRDAVRYRRMERVLRRRGVAGHRNLEADSSPAAVAGYFERRFAPEAKSALLAADRGGRLAKVSSLTAMVTGRAQQRQAVRDLQAAIAGPSYLSDDRIFLTRLDQMRDAVRRAVELVTSR